jgi:hypothetical protein
VSEFAVTEVLYRALRERAAGFVIVDVPL